MPGVKRNRADSDNEEGDHYSESDFSDDQSDQSEQSDSEESSELDEQECELRRQIYTGDISDLEKQFGFLREQLYKERIMQIEERLAAVHSGKAAEYLGPLNRLEESYNTRLEVADVVRQLRIQNIKTKYDAEVLAAEQNLKNELDLVKCRVHEELTEKVQRLREDRHVVNFTSSFWGEKSPKRLRRDKHDKNDDHKPVTVDGPFIVYKLPDEDIQEDWTTICRALNAQAQHSPNTSFEWE